MEFTMGYMLQRSAIKFAGKTAVVSGNLRLTYGELNRRVNRLARVLLESGIKKGDKIASLLFNSPQVIEIYFAAARIGAISVPINYRLVDTEIEYILDQSDSVALIFDSELAPTIAKLPPTDLRLISVGTGNSIEGAASYEELLAGVSDDEVTVDVAEKDLRFIMYTSGTTGQPKGAMFTHANNLWAALSLIINKRYAFGESVLFINPLYHMNSYINVIACMFMGHKMVVMRKFDASEFIRLMQQEEVSMCSVVPTICQALLALPPQQGSDLPKWRYCTCTGAPWPLESKKAFMERFPNVIMADAYGATEVFSGTLIQGPEILAKPYSVGRAYLDTLIRIVDESGKVLAAHEVGQIALFGPHVTQGYYKNPEATQESLVNGWFFPGDLGYFDEDDYLYVVDRKKDMIISGGENIYSMEVENVLRRHECVTEVAVVGVPNAHWGEIVKAYVVPRPGPVPTFEDLVEFCGKYLASYKKPREIEFVADLPRNSMGKIMKRDLRRSLAGGVQ
jgi:acyl-CoA synthetase (AMP-forming)/AMP-acid ligase II